MQQSMNLSMTPYTQAGNFVCSQYDVGRQCQITLIDDSGNYTIPTGATITVMATKPSGLGFSVACTWSESTVTFSTTATMTNEFGRFPAELRIEKDGLVLGTTNFYFKVEKSPHPDDVIDGDTIVQQNLVARVTTLETKMETAEADIADLKSDLDELSGGGLTEDVKVALLNCFDHVTWDDDDPTGQTYIDALEDALYPPADLVSISAVYTQGGTVYDNQTLDSLKTDLVVTAHMSDSTTQAVTTYTLSGTLATGTSTITVAYGGKTATFTVTVTHAVAQYTITNNLTNCTNNNSATVINEETAYSGTLTATSGNIMSTVTITMGGTDITSTAYNSETGAISIASVTGNVVITAEAVEDVGWISGQAYTVDWGEGGYILDTTTGAVITSGNTNDHVSALLPCHNASAVVCSTRPYDNYACFYDAEGTFLMRASIQAGIEDPYPIPVPRNAYYIRVRERSSTPNTISVIPYLYPTLTEGTLVELNTHYVMAYEDGTESESAVSLMGSCNGATKFNTSLYARSFIAFYDSSKTSLSTITRQTSATEIDIPSGAYYLTLNPNGYTSNVNNPWIKFTA